LTDLAVNDRNQKKFETALMQSDVPRANRASCQKYMAGQFQTIYPNHFSKERKEATRKALDRSSTNVFEIVNFLNQTKWSLNLGREQSLRVMRRSECLTGKNSREANWTVVLLMTIYRLLVVLDNERFLSVTVQRLAAAG
jgi:hypothetical protein